MSGVILGLIACGFLYFLTRTTSVVHISLLFALMGVGFAMFFTANVTFIMSHVPDGNEGVLSAFLALIANIGALVGISLFQISSRMGGNLSHVVKRNGLDPENILMGFKHATIIGAVFCLLALFLSYFSTKREK